MFTPKEVYGLSEEVVRAGVVLGEGGRGGTLGVFETVADDVSLRVKVRGRGGGVGFGLF